MPDEDPQDPRQHVDNVTVARHKAKKKQELEQRHRQLMVASLIYTVIVFTATLHLDIPAAIPMHTSILTGQLWLNELIHGHEGRFKDQLSIAKHVFFRLSFELQTCCGLRSTRHVTADEKLATFLHFARIGCSTRVLQERFQRSAETIQRYVHSNLICSDLISFWAALSIPPSRVLLVHFTPSTSICPPMTHHPKSKRNPNFTHTFAIAVVQLMGHTSMLGFYSSQWLAIGTGKASSARMYWQPATLCCFLCIFSVVGRAVHRTRKSTIMHAGLILLFLRVCITSLMLDSHCAMHL